MIVLRFYVHGISDSDAFADVAVRNVKGNAIVDLSLLDGDITGKIVILGPGVCPSGISLHLR